MVLRTATRKALRGNFLDIHNKTLKKNPSVISNVTISSNSDNSVHFVETNSIALAFVGHFEPQFIPFCLELSI